MSSITKIKFFLLITILFCLTSCKNTQKTVNFNDYQYVITMSRMLEKGAKLLFIDKNQEKNEDLYFNGQSISNISLWNNTIYLHSTRVNEHYQLSSNGTISQFSNALDGETFKTDASWVTNVGETTLIETINGGFVGGIYQSAVLYTKNNQKQSILLEDTNIDGVLEYKKRIYVATSEPKADYGFLVTNMENNSIEKRIVFDDRFLSSSGHLFNINNKIITYGNNTSHANYRKDITKSGLVSINSDTYEYKTFILPNADILWIVYQKEDTLYALTSQGTLYQFDENLNVLAKSKPADTNLLDIYFSEDKYIVRVIDDNDKLHIFVRHQDSADQNDIGVIYLYKKDDLSLQSEMPIKNTADHIRHDIFDIVLIK